MPTNAITNVRYVLSLSLYRINQAFPTPTPPAQWAHNDAALAGGGILINKRHAAEPPGSSKHNAPSLQVSNKVAVFPSTLAESGVGTGGGGGSGRCSLASQPPETNDPAMTGASRGVGQMTSNKTSRISAR